MAERKVTRLTGLSHGEQAALWDAYKKRRT